MTSAARHLRLVQPQCPFPTVHHGECLAAGCRYFIGGTDWCAHAAIERRGAMSTKEIAAALGVEQRAVEWELLRAVRKRRIGRLLRDWKDFEEAKGLHALALMAQWNGEEVSGVE